MNRIVSLTISPRDLAELSGCSEATIRKLIRHGTLPKVNGGPVAVPLSVAAAWLGCSTADLIANREILDQQRRTA